MKQSCGLLLSAILGLDISVIPARAAAPVADPSAGSQLSIDIDVVAKRLDEARQRIQPSLGASSYNFSPAALQTVPQIGNAPLNQVLLQAPGVAQDSFGQIHLRNEHANVQYRLNGVQLPEGLSVFGQAIESRFANSLTLITGALPASMVSRPPALSTFRPRPARPMRAARFPCTAGHSAGCNQASPTAAGSARWTTS